MTYDWTKKFNPHDYLITVNEMYRSNSYGLRYGQFLIYHLNKFHSEIIIPDEVNCFYDDAKVNDFIQYLYSNY